MSRALLVLGFILTASACIPWPRHSLLRPAVRFEVHGEDGGLVEGAGVRLIRYSQPHSRFEEAFLTSTDDAGVAQFAAERKWEAIFPLVMHGVRFYDFAWCISHPAHAAAIGPLERDTPQVQVALTPGDGGCPSDFQLILDARLR